MKVELSENGLLAITPENPTEAYALKKWGEAAFVFQEDRERAESGYFRGSMIMVNTVVM